MGDLRRVRDTCPITEKLIELLGEQEQLSPIDAERQQAAWLKQLLEKAYREARRRFERRRREGRVMLIQNGDHMQHEIDNAGVPAEQRSDWPLPSFDARDWAKSMSERFGMPFDEALPWCACMLMRGFDEHATRVSAPGAEVKS